MNFFIEISQLGYIYILQLKIFALVKRKRINNKKEISLKNYKFF